MTEGKTARGPCLCLALKSLWLELGGPLPSGSEAVFPVWTFVDKLIESCND